MIAGFLAGPIFAGLFVAAGMISVYVTKADISRRPSAAQLAATAHAGAH